MILSAAWLLAIKWSLLQRPVQRTSSMLLNARATTENCPSPWGICIPVRKFTNIVAVLFFFINCVNATIHVAIRPPVVEWPGRHLKKKKVTSVKHKPAGGIATPGGLKIGYVITFTRSRTKHFSSSEWLWTLTYIASRGTNRSMLLNARATTENCPSPWGICIPYESSPIL